jgi:adenylate cyclase, class 2
MTNHNEKEIEVKFYLSNLSALEQRLNGQHAELVRPRILETNIRFDSMDGKFMQSRQVLRLRRDDQIWLTYKGAGEIREDVTARQEIEFSVSDFTAALHFLEALGFRTAVRYEKYRKVYKVGDLLVTLDEMPYGNFCELEGPSTEVIEAVARKLELDWHHRVLISYLGLFDSLKQACHFSAANLTFEEFSQIKISPAEFQQIGIFAADV